MDLSNKSSDAKKRINDYVNTCLNTIQEILDDYNNSTLKTRENLLLFIENSKQNIFNSHQYCNNKLNEIDALIASLPSTLKTTIEGLQKKHEKRLEESNNIIDGYEKECEQEIERINTEYDILVSMKNDELDNLHFLNTKELKSRLSSFEKEEIKQSKELNSSIEDIISEIEQYKIKTDEEIEEIKREFVNTTSLCNGKMRSRRNDYISTERELRNKSLVDIGNYNKQIEEYNEKFFIMQRNIIDEFKHNLILCNEEYDKLFSEYHNNQLRLLEEQTQNKIKRYTYEIEKNMKVKVEKEKVNTKIQNVKIFKADYDDSLTYEINKANINSLVDIATFEKEHADAEIEKNNQIDFSTLECNFQTNVLQKKLDEKKNELEFFHNRFSLLKKYQNNLADLNAQLYDISITLELDKNQAERENKIEIERIETKKKISSIHYIDNVSKLELEKETYIAELDNQLKQIDFEIKKIHTSYDHVIFKTRADYNVEKTRIEHILRFFESKYKKETNTFKNDINLITSTNETLKKDILNVYFELLDGIKKGKQTIEEGIIDFKKYLSSSFDFSLNIFKEFFANKNLRLTPDIDKMIDDYLIATKEKRVHLQTICNVNEEKISNIEKEIISVESDIIYLESSRKTLLDKSKKELNKINDSNEKLEYKKMIDEDIKDLVEQIEEKNFLIHILKLRLKSHTKDYNSAQNEISKIDEGTKLLSKKESKKLFDLKLENVYYNEYDVFQEIVYGFFGNINSMLIQSENKKKKIRLLNKLYLKSLHIISKFNFKIINYSSSILKIYKEQMKKIYHICDINLLKEKKILGSNISSINREREIAIEEINAKSMTAKKICHDSELKCNMNILALKDNDNHVKSSFENEMITLNRQFTINTGALRENVSDMKKYYSTAILDADKTHQLCLISLSKEHLNYKHHYELELRKLELEFSNEKEKVVVISNSRYANASRNNQIKVNDLSLKVKILEMHRLKKIKEKTIAISETNTTLFEKTKQIEYEMQVEIDNMKKDCYKKFKHEKKKMLN